jgi:hypothetical protein
MGGQSSTLLHCAICSKPVDLAVDLSADENGKAVHEHCYVRYLTGSRMVAE